MTHRRVAELIREEVEATTQNMITLGPDAEGVRVYCRWHHDEVNYDEIWDVAGVRHVTVNCPKCDELSERIVRTLSTKHA